MSNRNRNNRYDMSRRHAPARPVAAPATRKAEPQVHIEIDVEKLNVGALIDLEEAGSSISRICNWLVEFGGCEMAALRALPPSQLMSIAEQVGEQIKDALDAPK